MSSLSSDSLPGTVVRAGRSRRQGIFWMLTIPQKDFTPYPVPQCSWIRGQLEAGEAGYVHWQVCAAFKKKQSLGGVKRIFGETAHCEITRSEESWNYVWKEETRVEGTQFEFGSMPFDRTSREGWERIWELAVSGNIESVEAQVTLTLTLD